MAASSASCAGWRNAASKHGGPDANTGRPGGDRGGEGQRLREVAVLEEVVLGQPHRRRAEPLGFLHEFQRARVVLRPRTLPLRRVATVEVDADVHTSYTSGANSTTVCSSSIASNRAWTRWPMRTVSGSQSTMLVTRRTPSSRSTNASTYGTRAANAGSGDAADHGEGVDGPGAAGLDELDGLAEAVGAPRPGIVLVVSARGAALDHHAARRVAAAQNGAAWPVISGAGRGGNARSVRRS